MKVLSLIVLFVSTVTFGQFVDYTYSPSIYDSDLILRDINQTQDGGYIASFDMQELNNINSKPTAGLMRLNLLGEVEWSFLLDIPDAEESCSFDVIQHSSGDYYLIGLYYHTTYNDMRPFVCRLDQNGSVLWSKEVVDVVVNMSGGYSVNRIYEISNGNLQMMISIFDQEIVMQIDQDGGLVWGVANANNEQVSGKNPGFDVLELNDGKFLSSSKKGGDFALTKYDSDGTILWHKVKELGQYSHIKSLMQSSTGEIYGLGFAMAQNGSDFPNLLLKLDENNGDIIWAKAFLDSLFYGTEFATLHEYDNNLIMNIGGDRGGYSTTAIYEVNKDGDFLAGYFTSPHNTMCEYLPMHVPNDSTAIISGAGYNLPNLHSRGFVSKSDDPLQFSECLMGDNASLNEYDFTEISFPTQPDFYTTSITSDKFVSANYSLLSMDVTRNLVCSELEVEENSAMQLSIYPNPANQQISIEGLSEGTYEMFDVTGALVLSGNLKENEHIDVSALKEGVYLLNVETETTVHSKRLIIQH